MFTEQFTSYKTRVYCVQTSMFITCLSHVYHVSKSCPRLTKNIGFGQAEVKVEFFVPHWVTVVVDCPASLATFWRRLHPQQHIWVWSIDCDKENQPFDPCDCQLQKEQIFDPCDCKSAYKPLNFFST